MIPVRWPHEHQIVLAAHDEFCHRPPIALFQSLRKKPIRFLTALIRTEIIGLLEIDRVNGIQRYKLLNLHNFICRLLHRLQFLIRNLYIVVAAHLVPLHDFIAWDVLLVNRTVEMLLNSTAVRLMQPMKGHRFRFGGRIKFDRNGNEAKGQ